MLKDVREYYRKKLKELLGYDPTLDQCPYNDPTLDWKDPYYMKPPFGGGSIKFDDESNKLNKSNNENKK